MEEAAKEGSRSAQLALHQMDHIDQYLSAAQVGITMTSIGLGFLGEPAVATLLEPVFGDVMSHGVATAISVALAYLLVTSAHVIVGEQAPKMTAITHAETHCPLVRAAPGVVPDRAPSRDLGAQQRLQLRRQANPADRGRERQRGRNRGGAAGHDRARGALRGARPRRGGHARGRLPPARAGGAAGDDADARARDRQLRRHGRDRAAALHHVRPHPPARDRGRQPRPRARRRALEPARADADGRGSRRADRAARARGADHAGDQAARRPARPTFAASAPRWR